MTAARPHLPAGPLDQAAVLASFEQVRPAPRPLPAHLRKTLRHLPPVRPGAPVAGGRRGARGRLAEPWHGRVDVVAGPAMGGIVIGHEVAAALGVRFVFAERAGGELTLRGFAAGAGSGALVVEDVVTTGGSAMETAALLERSGATVTGIAAIVGRTPPGTAPPEGLRTLLALQAPAWAPDDCPACAQGAELPHRVAAVSGVQAAERRRSVPSGHPPRWPSVGP